MSGLWNLFVKFITYGEHPPGAPVYTAPAALRPTVDDAASLPPAESTVWLRPGFSTSGDINIDGTPMAGPTDMNGNPMGTPMGSPFSLM